MASNSANSFSLRSKSISFILPCTPGISLSLLKKLMEATDERFGAVPVLPVAEAVKRIDAGGCVGAVDREGLFTTQTPQSFFRKRLASVLESYGASVKDEAEAWLAAGLELRCLEGERLNFKVTWPEDLRVARALARERGGAADNQLRFGFKNH